MYKNPVMLYKSLVIGVIVLFIGIALSPGITAADKLKSNCKEIESTAEYKEIITYIVGLWVTLNWINRRGNYRGEVNMTNMDGGDFGGFRLSGYRWSNGGIEYFEEFAIFVYAYRFIGYSGMSDWGHPFVRGITLGDIEWS